jgi:hypothetical protein
VGAHAIGRYRSAPEGLNADREHGERMVGCGAERAGEQMLVRGVPMEEIARRLRRDQGEVRDKIVWVALG